jgi:hypothetical protein
MSVCLQLNILAIQKITELRTLVQIAVYVSFPLLENIATLGTSELHELSTANAFYARSPT